MEVDAIRDEIRDFVHSKGWDSTNSIRSQSPRNLAMSVAIEAAELLECYQWGEEADRNSVASEIADVLIYAIRLADVLQIDVSSAILRKLTENRGREWVSP